MLIGGKLTNFSSLEKEIDRGLSEALFRDGVFILDSVLVAEEIAAFGSEIRLQRGSFKTAKVGKGTDASAESNIRRDRTAWWDFSHLTKTQSLLSPLFAQIKEVCNRELFLGLSELEGHYAIYEPGAFYRRHLDRFQNDGKRTLSMVLFFNPDWKEDDFGHLCLKNKRGEEQAISPIGGRIVLFLSADIPHEVEETRRERLSFAGWFKTR